MQNPHSHNAQFSVCNQRVNNKSRIWQKCCFSMVIKNYIFCVQNLINIKKVFTFNTTFCHVVQLKKTLREIFRISWNFRMFIFKFCVESVVKLTLHRILDITLKIYVNSREYKKLASSCVCRKWMPRISQFILTRLEGIKIWLNKLLQLSSTQLIFQLINNHVMIFVTQNEQRIFILYFTRNVTTYGILIMHYLFAVYYDIVIIFLMNELYKRHFVCTL